MPPVPLSSGDAIADRRMDYARMLFDGGDLQAALELVEQAVELVPAWAAGWFRLVEYREKANLVDMRWRPSGRSSRSSRRISSARA